MVAKIFQASSIFYVQHKRKMNKLFSEQQKTWFV